MVNRKTFSTVGYLVSFYIWWHVWSKSSTSSSVYIALWGVYVTRRTVQSVLVDIRSETSTDLFVLSTEWTYLWTFSSNIAGEVYSKNFQEPSATWVYLGCAGFLVAQLLNFYVHIVLRNTKLVHKKKTLPQSVMFKWVSCPHYTFEVLSWVGFYLASQTTFAGLYTGMIAVILMNWSKEKHLFLENLKCGAPKHMLVPFIF